MFSVVALLYVLYKVSHYMYSIVDLLCIVCTLLFKESMLWYVEITYNSQQSYH